MMVRMKAKDEITVNGTTYQAGDEFDIDDAAAVHVDAKYAVRVDGATPDAAREAAPMNRTAKRARRAKK